MKMELPSPRRPATVTPKQGSLYHEMGKARGPPSDMYHLKIQFGPMFTVWKGGELEQSQTPDQR